MRSQRKLAIRVPLERGESVRRRLKELGILDVSRKPRREDNFLLIPITHWIDSLSGLGEPVETELEEVEKRKGLWEELENLLGDEIQKIARSFDVVGDIAILEIDQDLIQRRGREIGEIFLKHLKNVRVVLAKGSEVSGEFRIRKYIHLAGERRTETVHREHDCLFKLDLEKVYFSPRLAYERMRVAEEVGDGEVVLDMFAGIGAFAITIARHSGASRVYAIDKNPHAYRYMVENIRLNKVENKVVPILGDSRNAPSLIGEKVDRVIMDNPTMSFEFLDIALKSLGKNGGIIHFYCIGRSFEEVEGNLSEIFSDLEVDYMVEERRVVREYAPRVYHMVLDLLVIP